MQTIDALVASRRESQDQGAYVENSLVTDIDEVTQSLMQPLLEIMEAHPSIERIKEASRDPLFHRSYRRRATIGVRAFQGVVAVKIDPPTHARRCVYIMVDTTNSEYLSSRAMPQKSASLENIYALIPTALDWCATLLIPAPAVAPAPAPSATTNYNRRNFNSLPQ